MAELPVSNALYLAACADLQSFVSESEFIRTDITLSVADFQARALLASLIKKFEDEVEMDQTDPPALKKFLDCNEKCASWSPPESLLSDTKDNLLLGEFRKNVYNFFTTPQFRPMTTQNNPFDWGSVLDWTRIAFFGNNGPGSALEASGTSWLEKFDQSPLSYSREFLWDLYRMNTHRYENGSDLSEDKIGGTLRAHVENTRESLHGHELKAASRLVFVPKTVSESRCICIEPSLNMLFQKGIQYILEEQLLGYFGINLHNQDKINQILAKEGSINGTYGTIDLTSASDTISKRLLKWAVPADMYTFFDVCRTSNVELPSGEVIPLHMVSSMGNAFTFPMQTALFACAVEAVYKVLGIPFIRRHSITAYDGDSVVQHKATGNWAVFGDDIIVCSDAYDDVIHLLELLGFKPNLNKSFNEGYFRESCGGDYYRGHGVRGVYCKSLRTDQDCYSLLNRLTRWTATTGLPLPLTCAYVRSRLKRPMLRVPAHESDDAGLHMPMALAEPKPLMQSKSNMRNPWYGSGHYFYECWEFKPKGLVRGKKGWVFSEEGTLLACLKGECMGGVLISRSDRKTFSIRRTSTHRWDSGEDGLLLSEEYMSAWKQACLTNYYG